MNMNSYRILISVLIFFLFSSIHAQVKPGNLFFTAFSGIATYKMDQMKELNKLTEKTLPFDVNTVDNFDPGFYLGGIVQTHLFSNLDICVRYQYNSTGSRIGQKDYSGYYTFDQIVNGHLLGIEPEVIIDENERYRISFSIMTGALFTRVKTKETLSISGDKEQVSEDLSAFSVPVYPSLKFSVPILTSISGSFSMGYMFDTGGKVHLKENRDIILLIDNTYVRTEWSGLRITLGMKINLINHPDNPKYSAIK
jgi:hypothetical protein